MARFDSTRRRFLAALTLVLAGFGLVRFLTPRVKPRRTLLSAPKGEVPVEGALVYRESRVALVREGGEVYALSLVCTHLGCTVGLGPDGFFCPCHGSRFDRQGKVLQGPADRPLERYRVEERGERFEVVL